MENKANLQCHRAGAGVGEVDALVVLLHGYGASGGDLIGLAEPFTEVLPGAAFVAPDAPQPNTINPAGRQWFPVPWLDGSSENAMRQGFVAAAEILNQFLDDELARLQLAASRLVLVGFSQGTMMSLHVGLRRDQAFAGIIGFSGRLVADELWSAGIQVRPPVLLVHGDMDEMIPVQDMHDAVAALAKEKVPVRWHVSRGIGHGIAPDGLAIAQAFLADVLRPASS